MSANDGAIQDLLNAQGAVLVRSCEVPADATSIKGFDFNGELTLSSLLASYKSTGFQASNLSLAIEQVNKMLEEREKQLEDSEDAFFPYPEGRRKRACTIFLGYTSNLVTSGLREVLRFIVQHDLVDCVVTSAGGVEEDLIKCLKESYLGAFNMDGKTLRSNGMNRAGNVLIPNDNYCAFEDWLNPILDECLAEQESGDVSWTPSKLIHRLGDRINDESSILYWAAKHRIPVFCPALTDGSLGDMLYFHSIRSPASLRIDIVEDVRHINTLAVKSRQTGSLIVGGGVVKHHINNANLMRNGSDFTVYINTGQEFDGSDSGAAPDEAVSWGKVKPTGSAVKVHAEATLVLPLLVAETFAKHRKNRVLAFFGFLALLTPCRPVSVCYQCATPNMISNWAATGLPVRPDNLYYDDRCFHTPTDLTEEQAGTDACTSSCMAMIIPVGNAYGVVRGCHERFLFDTSLAVTVAAAGPEICESNLVPDVVIGGNPATAKLSFCHPVAGEEGTLGCNDVSSSSATATCPRATPKQCKACSSFDGKGKCSGNDDKTATCAGVYCTKTRGKINGRYLEERGCAYVNPFQKDSCAWTDQTFNISTGSDGVLAPSRSKRDISMSFRAVQCFCNGPLCNGTPRLPFFLLPFLGLLLVRFL
ncbi:unnamed protein product [Caenorhabditis auriculariae]|uniref:deoxyhypusine synthase n=1 Tax=Caenorhabditis auriculariae TaxID=2777116 RepID=A0A8S1HM17_9PELO|nr:unnamed protein product [Caenorhabditis auriculariae]